MAQAGVGIETPLSVSIATQKEAMRVRSVLVCDSQELSRIGLRVSIESAMDLRVESEVENSRDILAEAQKIRPDVIVVELDSWLLEKSSRLRSITEVAPVVILSPSWGSRSALYVLRAGVRGLAGKMDRRSIIVEAVRAVARGETFLSPSAAGHLVERLLRGAPADSGMYKSVTMLTERELSVLRLLAAGKNTREIASDMCISPTTVKSHVSHMLTKLGLRNRVEAVVFAYRLGLTEG